MVSCLVFDLIPGFEASFGGIHAAADPEMNEEHRAVCSNVRIAVTVSFKWRVAGVGNIHHERIVSRISGAVQSVATDSPLLTQNHHLPGDPETI